MHDVDIFMELKVTTQNVSGRLLPALEVVKDRFYINTDFLYFDFGRSLTDKIGNALAFIFKKRIASYLEGQISSTLRTRVAPMINTEIQKNQGFAELWKTKNGS
jgi:hypothetical protein